MPPATTAPPPTAPAAPQTTIWLTPEEVAEMYQVSPITVRDWINAGVTYSDEKGNRKVIGLNGVKVGGRWRIHPDELGKFIKTLTGAGWESPAVHRETEAEKTKRVDECRKRLAGWFES